jgi:Flp pilus assembly protein TadB
LEQYNELAEITPSSVVGGKQPSREQLSFLRRAFLIYNPHTTSGWIWHTLFYMFASIFVFVVFIAVALAFQIGWTAFLVSILIYVLPVCIALLIIQRRARRNALRSAAQLEEPNA